jgi:CPA2 family monovalent cation:H+ antiporter-2
MSDFLEKFFFSFSLFSLFSFFGGLLSARWKQPTVIGLLLVGMFIGPKFLGLVSDDQTINILSEFGIYLLLFSLGLEFSISNIFGSLIRILFSLFFILSIMFLIGYETSLFLFKDVFVSIFVGLLFSFSSTAVFSNHLKSCKKIKGVDFSFPAYIMILQDLIAVVVLTVLISIKNNAFGPLSGDILEIAVLVLFPIFLSIIFFMLIYLILKNAINYLLNNFYHNIEDENVVLFVLGLTVLFSIIAGSLGLSSSIGAFIYIIFLFISWFAHFSFIHSR